MYKIFDNLLFTRMSIRFVSTKKAEKYKNDYNWQVVQVMPLHEWKKEHVLYATHITPIDFLNDYKEFINKDKKILLFRSGIDFTFYKKPDSIEETSELKEWKKKVRSSWRRDVQYYRILKHHGYKVYMVRTKQEEKWKEKKFR